MDAKGASEDDLFLNYDCTFDAILKKVSSEAENPGKHFEQP